MVSRTQFKVYLIAAIIAAAVLTFDLSQPLGVAGGVPYVVLVLVGILLPRRKDIFILAGVGSVLTVLGFFLSPPGGELTVVLINRGLALFCIWGAALLVISRHHHEEATMQTNEQIKNTHNLLLNAIESVPTMMGFYDSEDRFVLCNQEYKKALHKIEDMLVPGTTFQEICLAGAQRGMVEGYKDRPEEWVRVRTERLHNPGNPVLHQQQDGRWVLTADHKVPDGGTFITRTDVSAVVEAERALRESEERFSLAMRGANDGLWDWNLKTNDLYLSPRWCRMLGYEREELEPTLETWTSLVDPRDRDRALKEVQDYISGDADTFETEFSMRHKDGSWISILSRAFLVHENGEAVRLVGTHVDITERTHTQKNLLKLSHALEQSPSMVFITDIKGNIEYVNSMFTKISGYSADEVVGKNPRFLKSDETPPELYADLWQTIKSGNEWRGELKDRCKDGSIFWAQATISSVKDENGAITNFISMHEEITKRKNVESREYEARVKAEIANRAKSELLANMSHELRTPLNAIIGFSQAFQGQLFGPLGNDKYVEYADDINASGNHLLALINDILDMSAIEAGKLELNEAETPLEPIVASSLRLIAPRANSGGISLSSEIPSDLPNIYVDERRLKQILLNLLSNATKFTLPGGSVTFDATVCENNGIVIKIKDTGIGMNEEEVTKAMSEFGQVDSGLDRKEEGSGLGLPLTNSLVKLHGGTFSISSEKGVGTTVTVGFPPERVVRVA